MHLQYLFAAADVGPIDQHMAIEATGAEQGGVERFGSVRGRQDDDAAVALEAVHLDEQRVQGLFALVVPADDARAARLAECIEFVDENNAGGFRFGLLEHIADAGRTDADEHLDEVGARQAEERHARLAGDRFGEQRLAGARRADEQDPLRNSTAETLILLRTLQELDDFTEFFHRLVDAGDVLERDADIFLSVHLAAAATECHRRAGAAESLHHEDEEHDEQAGHHQQRHVNAQSTRTVLGPDVGEAVALQEFEERAVVVFQA